MSVRGPEEVMHVLLSAIDALQSSRLRAELLKQLIRPPQRQTWTFWQDSRFSPRTGPGQGVVWLFLTIPVRPEIGLAYSDEGYGLLGRPWGLVWAEHASYGAPDDWYDSFLNLGVDSGYFGPAVSC